jgi:hypothetical protein
VGRVLILVGLVPYPWLEFVDVKGRGAGLAFFYNFRDNLTTYEHPCELIKVRQLRSSLSLRFVNDMLYQ